MDKYLYVAMTGASQNALAQKAHANNLANISTNGFQKDLEQARSMPVFGDSFPARAFALSFDEIIVTTFTAGHERTLPLWLLNQLSRPRDVPVTNVVAMLVMMVTMLPILGAYYLTRGGESVAGSGGK